MQGGTGPTKSARVNIRRARVTRPLFAPGAYWVVREDANRNDNAADAALSTIQLADPRHAAPVADPHRTVGVDRHGIDIAPGVSLRGGYG